MPKLELEGREEIAFIPRTRTRKEYVIEQFDADEEETMLVIVNKEEARWLAEELLAFAEELADAEA